ncbi:hypothetical protein [Streptosporangium fragile]
MSWAVFVIGVLSVLLRFGVTRRERIGEVAICDHVGFVGIGLGGLAVLLAPGAGRDVVTGLIAYRPREGKGTALAVVAVGLALGVVGLLKGLGLIMSPCG